jgi:hypothetical protein
MMTQKRKEAELKVLQEKLPTNIYRFMDMETDNPYMAIAAKTNIGNVYTLKIELANFPESVPRVFVTRMLYDAKSEPLDSPDSSMHTLRSENGCTQICHSGRNAWTNMISLYKVYIKCRIWLEIYEEHLRSGEPIDFYLSHQS